MKLCNYLEKIFSSFLGVLFGLIVLYLTILSMFSTSAIDVNEHTYYLADHPLIHLISITAVIFLLFILRKKVPNVTIPQKFFKILLIAILALDVIWILSTQLSPYADQKCVLAVAKQLNQHDFSPFQKEGYGYLYRHQHGIILFYYLLTYIFGNYNYVAMQFINILAIAAVFICIPKISFLLFQKKLNANLTFILLILYFPISFYVTFVYGNLTGLAVAMWAIFFELQYFQSQKPLHAITSSVLIFFAIMLKQNNLIVLIAMVLLGLIHLIYHRRIKTTLLLFTLIACYLLGSFGLSKAITQITGEEVVEGVPMTAYLAMGLQEAAMAPGWYNDYNRTLYVKENCDSQVTSEIAVQNIKDSIHKFMADPNYTFQFFAKKIASEWNNPNFQCFWIQENRSTKLDLAPYVQKIIAGDSTSSFSSYFNILHTLILFGALSYVVLNFRHLRFDGLIFALIFVGGFIFHLLWEAKSQYTLPYFVLLIPYAVNGFILITDKLIRLKPEPSKAFLKTQLREGFFPFIIVFFIILGVCAMSHNKYLTSAIKLNGDEQNYQTYLDEFTYDDTEKNSLYTSINKL